MGSFRSLCTRLTLAALAAASIFILPSAPSAATPAGVPDTSFAGTGTVLVPLGSWAGAAAVAVQPDGMIVTAGEADVGGVNEIVSTRMTASGTLDPSYGSGGIVTVNINGGAGVDSGAALALQSDGKIVIAGTGRDGTYGPLEFAAVRLNTNGAPDRSFGHGGIASVAIGSYSIANSVVIQPDGKVVLGGTALGANGNDEFAAARLNANGTIDTGFGSDGVTTLAPTGGAWGMALQANGDVVLAGQTDYSNSSVSGAQQFMAARLTPAGALDTSFGEGGIVDVPVGSTSLGFGVAAQSDGKLVLAGPAFTNTGVAATVRLNPDGSLDTSYGSGGIGTLADWSGVNGITLDSSGRAVLPMTGPSAVRFTSAGHADGTFGTGGSAAVTVGSGGGYNGVAIQSSDGKIVLAGAATINGRIEIAVTRLTPSSSSSTTSAAPAAAASTTAAAAAAAASTTAAPEASACIRLDWAAYRSGQRADLASRARAAATTAGCASNRRAIKHRSRRAKRRRVGHPHRRPPVKR